MAYTAQGVVLKRCSQKAHFSPPSAMLSPVLALFSDTLSLQVVLEMASNNLRRKGRAPCSGFSKRHDLHHLPILGAITVNTRREHNDQARERCPALAAEDGSSSLIPLA